MQVPSRLTALIVRVTKTVFLIPKRYDKHPCLFLYLIFPTWGDFLGHYKKIFFSFATAGQTVNQSQTSQCEATLGEWLDKWNKRQKKNESKESRARN